MVLIAFRLQSEFGPQKRRGVAQKQRLVLIAFRLQSEFGLVISILLKTFINHRLNRLSASVRIWTKKPKPQ